jgi:GT2 family glycosyltransferase
MPDEPLVSVVIATWNRRLDVLETIRAVYGQEYPRFEIIVADNASTDGTADEIRASFPDVKLICLPENRGASGGRNAGMVLARGKYILCLDSDASPDYRTLRAIVRCFEDDPSVGAVNSKVINAATRDFDPTAGWAYSEKQKSKSGEMFFSHTFSETGCAFRREVLLKAGMFWERLFFGREGEELALRILDAGYRILYCPSAVVLHRVSPQKRIASTERLYHDFHNSLRIAITRYPWWMLVWMLPLKVAAELVKGLRRGDAAWVLKALGDTVRELIRLLRERKPIRSRTALEYLRFQRELGSLSWSLNSWLKSKT